MIGNVKHNRLIRISKKLSFLLRHAALEINLDISSDGYVAVDDLLSVVKENWTLQDIKEVVNKNDKQRFTLKNIDGILKIKANQGHSISRVDQLDLIPVDNPTFDIIHGTYYKNWEKIRKEGLSRMARNHIHFVKGLNFKCGLRKSAEIYIYINFEKAKCDSLKFYESENGVILCSGDSNGFIAPKYFLKVVSNNGQLIE